MGQHQSKSMTPIRAEDGTLLTDKALILERWSANFNQVLNKVSSVEEQAFSDIRQRPVILALDGCPTVAETEKAIDQLQIGKALVVMESHQKYIKWKV